MAEIPDPDHALADEIRGYLMKAFAPAAEGGAPTSPAALDERELQLAAAVLCLAVLRADHESRQDEHHVAERAVEKILGLGPDDAQRLLRKAEDELDASIPMRKFTALIDGGYSTERKRRVLESLWRVAFADADLAPHEEYLVRKIADLLHLTTADLVEAKVRAREAFLGGD